MVDRKCLTDIKFIQPGNLNLKRPYLQRYDGVGCEDYPHVQEEVIPLPKVKQLVEEAV